MAGSSCAGYDFEFSPDSRKLRPVKKWLRRSVRALAGLAMVLILAGIACLDRVDHRPYFREPYYAGTMTRLRASEQTNRLVSGELAAGFGRALLTPTINAPTDDPAHGKFRALPLAGYGNRHGKPAAKVHDDLFVKAVALRVNDRVGVMVGADALIIPPEVTDLVAERLAKESGLSREQIYLSATHTHSSLGGWGEGRFAEMVAGGFQPGARVWFADRIVEAVQGALRDLRPAQFGHGRFAAPQFIRNRLVGALGRVDPEFNYAVFRQDAGATAVLGVYGAHATCLPGDQLEFSGDYPGCWQRTVEKATGGTALFFAGGVGSHGPVIEGKSFASAEKVGQSLAQMFLEHFTATPLTNRVTFGALGLAVAMPPLNVRVSDDLRLRPWLAKELLPARRHSLLQVFRINDTLWLSTPCDFSGELALDIKAFLKTRGATATITSFNGDYVGYVIAPRYYHLNGYEPRQMSFFGPNVPDYFDELMRTMSMALLP